MLNDKELYAVVIIKNEKIIYRQFFNDKTENDLFHVQSITKSIIAILIGIAIDKGFIINVDQPILDFFPEIFADKDVTKRQITIRHLLNQTSGLRDFEYPRLDEWKNDLNPTQLILSQQLISKPGAIHQYNTAATHLLSAIIAKVYKADTAKFAEDNLFKQLGITTYRWDKLKDGYNDGGGVSFWMKTNDLVKIGELLLNRGKYNNQQVVSERWINELFSPVNKVKTLHGLKDSMVGFCWYQAKYNDQIVNYAAGYGGQFLFIFSDLNAAIAVNHNHDTATGIEQMITFAKKDFPLLFQKIISDKTK